MVCVICGATNSAEARFCQSCGAALSPDTSGSPSGPPPGPPGRIVVSLQIARLGDRLLALILDSVLLVAAFVVVGAWAAKRWGGLTAAGFEMNGLPALITIGAVLAVGFLYYWLFEAFFGATLGKAIVGVAVCNVEGHRCGLRRSFIRNLLRIVDGLIAYLVGFLVALFSKQRQRLGDHLAGTYVVERGVGGFGRALLALVWLAALAGGIWGTVAIRRGAATGGAEAVTTTATPETTTTTAETTTTTTTAETSVTKTRPSPPPVLMSGDLKLRDFAFLQSDDGPPRAAGPAKPGERLFASFKVTGLSTDSEGKIHLQYGVEVLDANGLLMYKLAKELHGSPGSSGTATISPWFDVPVFAPPGTSKVRVTGRDEVKKTEGEIVAPIEVDAPASVVSTQLEIRGLHFTVSDDGPPLDPAVLKAGATLYIAGNLAGMQFREDQVDVVIAFQVLGPDGATVLDNPSLIEIKGSYPYHPPTFYLPITAHLRLAPDATRGVYKERYIATDRIGGATRTHELSFTLE
jgi:uncharacterized RDD family membrane protein YckC